MNVTAEKASKLHIIGRFVRESTGNHWNPLTQKVSNAETISMSWRHHAPASTGEGLSQISRAVTLFRPDTPEAEVTDQWPARSSDLRSKHL